MRLLRKLLCDNVLHNYFWSNKSEMSFESSKNVGFLYVLAFF